MDQILHRKTQHIDLCAQEDVEAEGRFTGFSQVEFCPQTLPEVDFDQVDCSVTMWGKTFAAPILITGMTGGVERGTAINRALASVAARHNIPMGVGSQRVALEQAHLAEIFQLKTHFPDLFLIGNLGCAQLLEPNYLTDCQRAVDMIQADVLAIHLNVVQECVQSEGDRHFKGILSRIAILCRTLNVPVLIKEVGSGVDVATARRLSDAGIQTIDVGGRGGTSWPYIEGLRGTEAATQAVGHTFRNWGIPTAYSLTAVRSAAPELNVIATGGIRDGLTLAKALALGAKLGGVGLPFMRAALEDEHAVETVFATLVQGLKTTMVATGSSCLTDLRKHLVLGRPYETEFLASLRAP